MYNDAPTVVPALCMLNRNLSPPPPPTPASCPATVWSSRRCTSAISGLMLAVGVPSGMRQKSATHFGGVGRASGGEDMGCDLAVELEGGIVVGWWRRWEY